MKLVTYRTAHGTQAGRVEGSSVIPLDFPDVGALLQAGAGVTAPDTAAPLPLETLDLAPVVVAPRKIICLGLNYESHILEMGRALPEHPTVFAKFARSLIGARDAIVLPVVSSCVDWEAELAFVIGREVRHATPAEAVGAIAGFTVLNDVSMRDYQNRTLQFLQGKTFESSTPVGPWLVSPDELPGGAEGTPDLAISCTVDGDVKQSSRTSDLLFAPPAIVAYLSRIITLEPGDLISTGTPGGVGHACSPPVYLEAGQTVVTTIEGIGSLENRTVAEGT